MNKHVAHLLAIVVCTIGCTSTEPVEQYRARSAVTAVVAGQEFRQLLSNSRFHLGAGTPSASTEGGFSKVIGVDGVFATDIVNGSILGVSNGTSLAVYRGPLTSSGDSHNAYTLAYFESAGLPSAEVGSVQANAVMAGGWTATGTRVPDRLVGFSSVIGRKLAGIRVAESFAWARFNKDGETVAEGVYWPSIPANVVSAAHDLQARLNDTTAQQNYATHIFNNYPEMLGPPTGEIVMHHSDSTSHGTFGAIVSFDVVFGAAGEKPRIRHFDDEANELDLPYESSAAGHSTRP